MAVHAVITSHSRANTFDASHTDDCADGDDEVFVYDDDDYDDSITTTMKIIKIMMIMKKTLMLMRIVKTMRLMIMRSRFM